MIRSSSHYHNSFNMADHLSPEQRHLNMAAIRGKDTKPEVVVRQYLWHHGYRYRLNYKRLPGKPDIVMRKFHICIFINGCFWHGHDGCKYYTIPKTNVEFWVNKIKRNIEHDTEVQQRLAALGWHCITIWECELKPSKRKVTLDSLLHTLNMLHDDNVQAANLSNDSLIVDALANDKTLISNIKIV